MKKLAKSTRNHLCGRVLLIQLHQIIDTRAFFYCTTFLFHHLRTVFLLITRKFSTLHKIWENTGFHSGKKTHKPQQLWAKILVLSDFEWFLQIITTTIMQEMIYWTIRQDKNLCSKLPKFMDFFPQFRTSVGSFLCQIFLPYWNTSDLTYYLGSIIAKKNFLIFYALRHPLPTSRLILLL